MLKIIISILIAILLFHFFHIIPTFGQSLRNEAEIAKIKADLAKRGLGEKAKVKIELNDGREIKGYIAEMNADDFVIADSKSGGRTTTIAYSEVTKVKKQGWSLGVKLGIAGMILGGIIIAVTANKGVKCQLCP